MPFLYGNVQRRCPGRGGCSIDVFGRVLKRSIGGRAIVLNVFDFLQNELDNVNVIVCSCVVQSGGAVVVMLVQRNALEQMFFQSMKIVRGGGQKKRARGGARVVGWIGCRAGSAAGGRELEEDEKKIHVAAEGGSREARQQVMCADATVLVVSGPDRLPPKTDLNKFTLTF